MSEEHPDYFAPTVPDEPPEPTWNGAVFQGNLTPAQHRAWAEQAVADGTMSRELADAALAAAGIFPPAPPPREEGLGPEAAEIDKWFPPATKTSDYRLPAVIGEDGRPVTDPDEFLELDRLRRQWLLDAELPADIGAAIVNEGTRYAQRWSNMNDSERDADERATVKKLGEMWGHEKAAQRIAYAKRVIEVLDQHRPGLKLYLNETGMGSSIFVIQKLALHFERRAARYAPRPERKK